MPRPSCSSALKSSRMRNCTSCAACRKICCTGLSVRRLVDGERAALAVILAVEIGVVFRALEIGQHVGERPAGIAERRPLIVVGAVAADIDHRVDGGRAAEPLAARLIADAAVEALLRHGVEGPVVDFAGDHQHQRERCRDHPIVVLAAGIQQRHRNVRILRQPSRHRAAARAAAHHHEIECIRHAHPPEFFVLAGPHGHALGPKLRFCGVYGKSGSTRRFCLAQTRVFAVIKSSKAEPFPFPKQGDVDTYPSHPMALPGLPSQEASGRDRSAPNTRWPVHFRSGFSKAVQRFNAGWSSPVARQAHNLKVIGSNPIPATNFECKTPALAAGVFIWGVTSRPCPRALVSGLRQRPVKNPLRHFGSSVRDCGVVTLYRSGHNRFTAMRRPHSSLLRSDAHPSNVNPSNHTKAWCSIICSNDGIGIRNRSV